MKPEDLGYKFNNNSWYKIEYCSLLQIELDEDNKYSGILTTNIIFSCQSNLDQLQIVFNNLQRDLKELNK